MARSRKRASRSAAPNRWLLIGIALILLAALGFGLFQAAGSGGAAPREISVAEASARRDQGAFLLDVRTSEEWEDFHVPGSTLIPLDELETRVNEVPRDREIVVVCRSGNRSQAGRDILLDAGFTNVTSMAGGLNDWRTQGYPTVAGP